MSLYLRKFAVATAVSAATLLGCSRHQPHFPEDPPPVSAPATVASLPVIMTGPSWSVQLPVGWTVVEAPTPEPPNACEGAAKTLRHIGAIPMFFIVNSTSWDEALTGPIEAFPAAAAAKLEARSHSLGSRPANFAGEVGMVSVGTLDIGSTVMQVAVTHKGKGYVLRCAGDPDKNIELVSRCMTIWRNFKFTE